MTRREAWYFFGTMSRFGAWSVGHRYFFGTMRKFGAWIVRLIDKRQEAANDIRW